MIAGVSGMLTMLLAGSALVAARRAAERAYDPAEALEVPAFELRKLVTSLRRTAGLLGLLVVAAFCGYQLQVIHDDCLSLRWGTHLVIVIGGTQFMQLFVLHAVLTFALTLTALSTCRAISTDNRRGWTPAQFPRAKNLAGLAGLLAAISAGLAFHSTYPASILDVTGRSYFIMLFLVTVPMTVLLLMASLFLLLRRRTLFGIDADPDLPFCLDCEYNLTGNTSGRCPECGSFVPPAMASWLAEKPLHTETQGTSRCPQSIVCACFVYAFFCALLAFIRLYEPLGHVVYNFIPRRELWNLVHSYSDFYWPRPPVAIGLSFAMAGMLFTGALGLRQRRCWGAWVCLAWLLLSIQLVILGAIRSASGYVYPVSPGAHTDIACLRIAFIKTLLGAGFPIFLGLWLLQRQVRRRIAGWSQ